jgi:iron complex outermembrane receptor protein
MTDGQGNRVVNQNGNDYVLDKEEFVRQGNIADRVFGGVMSDFFWKGFNFHVGIDYKFGGSLFSYSNYYLLGMGISKETLKYRDEDNGGLAYYIDDATGSTVAWQHDQAAPPEARDGLVYHDGLIMPGVVQTGGSAEDPVYSPNEKIIGASEYYSTAYIRDMSTDFQPDNLYKNEYIKLRELALAYTVPVKYSEKLKIQKLVVSFLARDLFYFYKSIPNIDSESALGSGSFTEYSFFPSVRSYGIGVNVSF